MFRYFLVLFISISLSHFSFAQLTLVSEKLYCTEAAELFKEYRYDEAYHRYMNCAREFSKTDTFAYHLLLLNAGISAVESSDYLKAEKLLLTCKNYFSQADSAYYYVWVLSNLASMEKRRTNYNQADA